MHDNESDSARAKNHPGGRRKFGICMRARSSIPLLLSAIAEKSEREVGRNDREHETRRSRRPHTRQIVFDL